MSDPAAGRKFQVINPPNLLKSKVGSGGFALGAVDKAAKVIDGLRGEFEEIAKVEVVKLVAAAAALMAQPNDLAKRDEVYKIAHELRGQGGSYGYPLVTRSRSVWPVTMMMGRNWFGESRSVRILRTNSRPETG